MSFVELLIVVGLAAMIAGPFVVGFISRDPVRFWSPLTVFALVFSYYFLIGPLLLLAFGMTYAYGRDMRDVMWRPWLGGALEMAAIYLGFCVPLFRFRPRPPMPVNPLTIGPVRTACMLLLAVGCVGFAYYVQGSGKSIWTILTPVADDPEATAVGGRGIAAGNYLFLLINAFIPFVCLWFVLNAGKPFATRITWVAVPVVLILFFYTTLGFRHRIVMLFLCLFATAHLLRGRRPRIPLMIGGALALIFIAGLIVQTREYNKGLDLSRAAGLSFFDILFGGFNDSGTFLTTAMLMEYVPSHVPFVTFEPLWVAATIPIPRLLWSGKPEPEYLWTINDLSGTQGQAVPLVGEHYFMFGWVGIFIGGLIWGMIYRGFWNFYRANQSDPFATVIYAVSWTLVFAVVSRGYLAQTLMEFFFTLMPLVLMFMFLRRRVPVMPMAPLPHASPQMRGWYR